VLIDHTFDNYYTQMQQEVSLDAELNMIQIRTLRLSNEKTETLIYGLESGKTEIGPLNDYILECITDC
jgi:hypothetical protein